LADLTRGAARSCAINWAAFTVDTFFISVALDTEAWVVTHAVRTALIGFAFDQRTSVDTDAVSAHFALWTLIPHAGSSTLTLDAALTARTIGIFIGDSITVVIIAVAAVLQRLFAESTGVSQALVDGPVAIII